MVLRRLYARIPGRKLKKMPLVIPYVLFNVIFTTLQLQVHRYITEE